MYDQNGARQQAAQGGRLRGFRAIAALTMSLAAATGCQGSEPDSAPLGVSEQAAEGSADALSAPWRRHIGWGSAPDQLTLRLPGHEQVATGPSALALTTSGKLLIADRLAGRVVSVQQDGTLRHHASIPSDAMSIAAGPQGDFAALSLLQARVWVHGASGELLGELATPRALRELIGVELGPSRQLMAVNGYQERLPLGSPSAPLPLRTTLSGKQEGAARLPDGRGVATQLQEDKAELLIITQRSAEAERSSVQTRLLLSDHASAARVVGVDGTVVCARIEQVTELPELAVNRRVICLDSATGKRLLEVDLGRPGAYLPQQELALGHAELAFMRPSADGLALYRWPLRARSTDAQAARVGVSP